MSLSDVQIERYSRQIVLPEVGGRGQEALLRSAVAVIGCGQLARCAALYLAGAGIGRLDLFTAPGDPQRPAARLGDELAALNPEVTVGTGVLPGAASGGWAAPYDVVVEATGSAALLAAANAAALRRRRPLVAGAVEGWRGWLGVFAGYEPDRPCAACPTLGTPGEAGAPFAAALEPSVAGVIGSLQALEVLKLCLQLDPVLTGSLLEYDARGSTTTERPIVKRRDCPACGPAARPLG